MLIDCHIHQPKLLNIDEAEFQREVQWAREAGIGCWVVTSLTVEDSRIVVQMVDDQEEFFACVGVHPLFADQYHDDSLRQLGDLARSSPKVVGIGEVGLEYRRTTLAPELQQRVLRQQIGLARELHLPLNLHTYSIGAQATTALADVLEQERAYEVGGVLHNFKGDEEMARRLVDMGFYLSVCLYLFHPQEERLRKVYRAVPLGNMVLDTDYPGMLLERTGPGEYPFEIDKRAHLQNLRRIADRLAGEKQMDVEQVMAVTSKNVLRAFPKMAAAVSSQRRL